MNQWKELINICAITETALSRFFPALFNPVRRQADGLSVRQNRASCVLRHSK